MISRKWTCLVTRLALWRAVQPTLRCASGALVAGSVLLLPAHGTVPQSCSGDVPQLTPMQVVCAPSDCTLRPLNWGTGGASLLPIVVEKFDPALGELQSVDLRLSGRFAVSGCLDNLAPNCPLADISFTFLGLALPRAGNQPRLTGVAALQVMSQYWPTAGGLPLGAADGMDDCATPGVTFGAPSSGKCVSGEDHFVYSSDTQRQGSSLQLSGFDLVAWIGPGQVQFDTMAQSSFTITPSAGLNQWNLAEARLELEVVYSYCPSPARVYCSCDSSLQAPCANPGALGAGCANSTGQGARLSASGSASIVAGDLKLHGSQLPRHRTGLFFQGERALNGGSGQVFGDGLRCTGTALVRLEVLDSDGRGALESQVNLAQRGAVQPGDLRRYQLWYRDAQNSPCGSTFNLSNGLEIRWLP